MVWPWLAVIAKNVPWMELVRRTPAILARSRELLEETKPRRSGTDSLVERVEVLEDRDAEHARIIATIVDQLLGLTESVQVLTARNKLLAACVVLLLVLQIVTLVAALQ